MRTRLCIQRFIGAFVLMASAFVANSATVNYDESANGDLGNDTTVATFLGTLGEGVNTVTGSMNCSTTFCENDFFMFETPTGTVVTEAQYSWTRVLDTDPENGNSRLVNIRWSLSEIGEDFLPDIVSTMTHCVDDYPGDCSLSYEHDSPTTAFDDALEQIESGAYWVIGLDGTGHKGFGPNAFTFQPQQVDYQWSITVSSVPLPATAWLFGSALGFLGWMRHR